jgi:hypothetical protein
LIFIIRGDAIGYTSQEKTNNIQNQFHPNFNAYQPPQLGSSQNNLDYGFNQPFYVNNAPFPSIKIKTRISKFDLI